MREPREGQENEEQGIHYLVLNRSCADLYEAIAKLFAGRPYIKVIVDRRQGKGQMEEIVPSGLRLTMGRGRLKQQTILLETPESVNGTS